MHRSAQSAILLLTLLAAPAASLAETPQMTTAAELPAEWPAATPAAPADAADTAWWASFGDPTLDALLAAGRERNWDVRMASRRLEMSRLAIAQARAGYYPTLGLAAGWQHERTAGAIEGQGAKSANSRSWSLAAEASWEADVFGRVRAGVREKRAMYDATRAERAGVELSMAAEIASQYITLRQLQIERRLTASHVRSQDTILAKVEARWKAGLVPGYDVSQSKTVCYSTRASLPAYDAQIRAAANSLAVLTGLTPAETEALLADSLQASLPVPAWLPPTGIPADLLRRRPDVLEAEATVAADAAALGVARKEYLPALTIEGTIGTYSRGIDGLFGSESLGWSLAPKLSWTAFDGGARRAAVAEARQQLEADADNYNLTVANAVAEVDNALASYEAARRQQQLCALACEQARISLRDILKEYLSGLCSYSDVSGAQIDVVDYGNQTVSAQADALQALITLYKALGGAPE